MLLLALSLLPFIAPYLFTYDLSVLVLAGAALTGSKEQATYLKKTFVLTAVLINTYAILVLTPALKPLATPFWLVLVYLEVYRRLFTLFWQGITGSTKGSAQQASGAENS